MKKKYFVFLQFFHLGPLDPYKLLFNPINRPWDLSRSIELGLIYIFVDLELHSAYLIPIHAQKGQIYSIFGENQLKSPMGPVGLPVGARGVSRGGPWGIPWGPVGYPWRPVGARGVPRGFL